MVPANGAIVNGWLHAGDFVDELPKNNYGKILKRELRAKYWEDKARKV